ncbi:hypothetical protein AOLI_G00166510 [Acnodon oligacanthus]
MDCQHWGSNRRPSGHRAGSLTSSPRHPSPSIHLSRFSLRVAGGAGAYPSGHRAEGRIPSGQLYATRPGEAPKSLSQRQLKEEH